ncbi:MAG TPA: ABC transporter permease, partial [Vicinamibacterales bacterium]|nr:ABC transporter permease [Vicinamibacterales bacterium]
MSTRRRSDGDFDDEIRAHLEAETDRLVADGMSRADAEAAARRAFGNVTRVREDFHDRGRLLWLDHLRQDLIGALRSMRRYPVATLVALVSLAAGIGATAVTLSVRDVLFHRFPPTYQQPEQLSRVQVGRADEPIRPLGSAVPAPLFSRWRDSLGSTIGGTISLGQRDIRAGSTTATASIRAVTSELFDLLGVRAVIGPGFAFGSRSRSNVSPVVLSDRLWEQLFDRRPDVVGETVWIDNRPYAIAGVMPQRFWLSDMNSPMWTLLDPARLSSDQRVETIVRRPSGTSPQALEAQLTSQLESFASSLPADQRRLIVKVSDMRGTPLGHQMSIVLHYLLGVSVLLTLLIACANVAVLMIAQWTAREHEIAIRASLGASRGRVVRGRLTESMVVAGLGGVAGVWAAYVLRSWVVQRAGGNSMYDLTVEPRIFLQTAVVALLTGLAAGLGPALYETRRMQNNPLRAMAGADRVRQRWRHALVVFEIAVTAALLVVTSAMIQGYLRASRADMGFATRLLMTARIENPDGVAVASAVDAVRNLSGVADAAAASSLPFSARSPDQRIASQSGAADVVAERVALFGPFLHVLGVPMRTGRDFTAADRSARSVIINEALERRLFAGSGLGEKVWIDGVPYDVIGVAANYASNPFRDPVAEPRVFTPMSDQARTTERVHVLIRAVADPAGLVQAVRKEIRASAPGNVATSAYPLDQIIDVMGQEMLVG